MADRSTFVKLDLPRPAPVPVVAAKANSASGVTFIGNSETGDLQYLYSRRGNYERERLDRSVAFSLSAYCYTAMQWRASRLASAPLMVVRETDIGEEWQPKHPLAQLLMRPRPDIQMGELLERTQLYRDLTGSALWVAATDPLGRIRMVTPYSDDEFRTAAVPPLIYGKYEVLQPAGSWKAVPPELVVHFRETNPSSWREAFSKVDAAMLQLDLGHNVSRIVYQFLRKAMFPGGIISPDEEWEPEPHEWADWKAQIKAWHQGPSNHGAPLTVLGGTRFTPVNSGMKDLLPEAILNRVEATVGSVFGVPPVVLGWLSGMENSPWSQMAEARRQVYEDTIAPLWDDVASRLTNAWLTEEEQAAGLLIRFDTSRIVALKQDQERQARIAALTADTGTVNERRALLGWDPLPADDPRGEEIVGLAQAPLPDSIGAGGGEDDDLEEDPDLEDDEAVDGGKSAMADTKDLLWVIFDVETKAAERGWVSGVYAHLQDLKGTVLAAASKTLQNEKAKRLNPDSAARFQLVLEGILEQDRPKFAKRVKPLIVATGSKAVRRLSARLSVGFDVLQPGLLKYAERSTSFLVLKMGKTTGELVSAAVQKGLAEGESVAGLMKRLKDLPAFDRDRAKLTARTETTRAWNGAQRGALSDYEARTGKTAEKSWLSSRDSRVREEHEALDDGDFIPIDQPFGNGLQEPGEPNCRCTLLYRFADAPLEGTTQ